MSDLAIDLQGLEFPRNVGGRISHYRQLAQITQKDLAAAIEKSRPTIVQYEANRISPPLSVIRELARVLRTTPEYLAFGIDLASEGQSSKIDVSIGELEEDGEFTTSESAHLPGRIVRSNYGVEGTPQLIRLDNDAPRFGLSKGDLLLVDRSARIAPGDGKYYAISTSAGLSVVLNAVHLVPRPGQFELQDGTGERHHLTEPPEVLGRCCGALISL